MKRPFLAPWVMILAFLMTACGGGGGGGGVTGGVTYSGVTTKASLTAANANLIFAVMWNGGTSSEMISPTSGVAKAEPFGKTKDGGFFPPVRRLANIMTENVAGFSGSAKSVNRMIPVNETRSGTVSGTATMTGSVNDSTGTGSITMTYTNYNDGDGVTYGGAVTLRVDGYDMATDVVTDGTMSFAVCTIKSATSDFALSGSIRMQENGQSGSEVLTINMDGRDNLGNESFRFENYVLTIAYSSLTFSTSWTESYSGRVYAEKFGYVEISTVSPCMYSDSNANPSSGGPIILAGAGNTSASVSPVSKSHVKIEVDDNGDSVFEGNKAYAWSNLAGAPEAFSCIANAGPDKTVSVGTLVTLDGSGSVDLNGGDLTYSWTITSKPTGSGADLSSPSSKTTTLITDMMGDYVISLIVSNGATNSSPDTVIIKATSGGLTLNQPPARTNDATNVTDMTATLNGSYTGDPLIGATVTAWFEYGTTNSYGNTATVNDPAMISTQWVAISINGLQQQTTYHFRFVVQNANGTFYGLDKTFTTLSIQVLATGLIFPSALTVDSTNVYWIDLGTGFATGTIKKTGISGGVVTTLASGLGHPTYLAVDSTSVYWTDEVAGTLNKVSINGGAVFNLVSGLRQPLFLAVDSTSVYWTDGTVGTINKVSINGGAVTTLATGVSAVSGIFTDSASVYWLETSAIKKIGINGGAITTLASVLSSGLPSPTAIAVDAVSVYWMEYSAVKKVGINGGPVTTLASELLYPTGLAVDSTGVYWIESSYPRMTRTIKRVSLNGGTIITLASGLEYLTCIAVDSTSVYWTDSVSIKKIPKN